MVESSNKLVLMSIKIKRFYSEILKIDYELAPIAQTDVKSGENW